MIINPHELKVDLHPKQWLMINSLATKILFGGAAGGGKSYAMRWAAIIYSVEIAGLQTYIFRREREDLMSNHMKGPQGFREILAEWVNQGLCEIIEDEIRFWNGSRIYLRHCQLEKHKYKYQGAEIHLLMIEELTQFTREIYEYLTTRVRMVGVNIPEKYKGRFPRILLATNPANLGHAWVKEMFIDKGPLTIFKEKGVKGMLRQFIPSLPSDNPSLLEEDPGYIERLKAQSDPELVKAYLYGDWNISAGTFFTNFSSKNRIAPFTIPEHWTRFRAFDWGANDPFCVHWYAVSDGEMVRDEEGNERHVPKGCIVLYREWYGADANRKGLQLTNEEIARGILSREEPTERFLYNLADSMFFAKHGAPSPAESFKAIDTSLNFTMAKNDRVQGWGQVRSRLTGSDQGPMLLIFTTCVNTIRCLGAVIRDDKKIEDIADGQEDHAVDPVRYACMSRPYVKELPKPKHVPYEPTMADLEKQQEEQLDLRFL